VKTIPVPNSSGQNPNESVESSGSHRLLYFFAFLILLAAAFGRPLGSLARHAAATHLHSHILLIPFLSAYLLFIGRTQLSKQYAFSWQWIALFLVGGIAALLGGTGVFNPALSENDSLSLMTLSFVCFLAAGGFLVMGSKWMAAAAFPFGFLVFMIPLPDAIVNWLETASKLASAEVAALLFSVTGTPMLRDGAVFQLPGIALEVAQECSGIRSSWVLFITSVLASFLFLKSSWRRVVLVAFVIPLGILRNGIRILTIGLLCVHVGPEMINSIIHNQGGPLFFALSLGPLFLLLWWLRRDERKAQR
jgi:exosortase C (VPDSG-CTERM-specific)